MIVDTEQLLRDLAHRNFWGTVELRFQRGKVISIVKIESFLTKDYEFGRRPRPQYESREADLEHER